MLNNTDFQAYIGQIYPPELELKKTIEGHDSCSYLDERYMTKGIPLVFQESIFHTWIATYPQNQHIE